MSSLTSRREIVLAADVPLSLQHDLELQGFRVLVVEDCDSALQVIRGHAFDALLIAVNCDQQTEFWGRFQQIDAALQVLVFTDSELPHLAALPTSVDVISAVEPLGKLLPRICRAVELTQLRRDNCRLRQQLAAASPSSAGSPSLAPLGRDMALTAAPAGLGLAIGGDADLAAISRAHVIAVLAQHNGNKAQTARALGINRRSLYRLLEKYQSEQL